MRPVRLRGVSEPARWTRSSAAPLLRQYTLPLVDDLIRAVARRSALSPQLSVTYVTLSHLFPPTTTPLTITTPQQDDKLCIFCELSHDVPTISSAVYPIMNSNFKSSNAHTRHYIPLCIYQYICSSTVQLGGAGTVYSLLKQSSIHFCYSTLQRKVLQFFFFFTVPLRYNADDLCDSRNHELLHRLRFT